MIVAPVGAKVACLKDFQGGCERNRSQPSAKPGWARKELRYSQPGNPKCVRRSGVSEMATCNPLPWRIHKQITERLQLARNLRACAVSGPVHFKKVDMAGET